MVKVIESNLYRISKMDEYDEDVFNVEIKETNSCIQVYRVELAELIELLQKADEYID